MCGLQPADKDKARGLSSHTCMPIGRDAELYSLLSMIDPRKYPRKLAQPGVRTHTCPCKDVRQPVLSIQVAVACEERGRADGRRVAGLCWRDGRRRGAPG